MAAQPSQPIHIFLSSASADESLCKQFLAHMNTLIQEGRITLWHSANILAGSNTTKESTDQLNKAQIILLLISANFFASPSCQTEMKQALIRHDAKQAWVIPILLRPYEWEHTPLGNFAPLPANKKPISTWSDHEEACAEIVRGIRQIIDALPPLLPLASQLPAQTQAATPSTSEKQTIWNIPYPRNPLFTGRENILTNIHQTLNSDAPTALTQPYTPPQALSGLGGIGKTQTALEYTYRYRDNYTAVLWVNATSLETLIADYVSISDLLRLPESAAQDQKLAVAAVLHWLNTHPNWLLILDNADDLKMAYDYLPREGKGHVLLTTRAQTTGERVQAVAMEKMAETEGTDFLLRRAKISTPSPTQRDVACQIVQELDGLPLALDQAGAYIEETGCGLSGYLSLYQTSRADLLKARGDLPSYHPDPVATTWKLAFEKVQAANPAAADLLNLCAFLAPDAIPEEMFLQAPPEVGTNLLSLVNNPYKLNEAIKALRAYSLVSRDTENQALTIHRLVQAVIKDEMDAQTRYQWAKRAVRVVGKNFPDADQVTNWPRCKAYSPHALTCAEHIKQWNMAFSEARDLLYQAGSYLHAHARYQEAEPLWQQTLTIYKNVFGDDHPSTAGWLNNLAILYKEQGQYEQAESLYQQALTIQQQALGDNHPNTAQILNNLANLYSEQGKYEQAEPLYQRAITIRKQVLRANHPDTAQTLNNLAALYDEQGQHEQAEPLYQQALIIDQQVYGPNHPIVAADLSNLAILYKNQNKDEQAMLLFQRALRIFEQVLGANHPDTAQNLNNLANLYSEQGQYEQAEPLYQHALRIYKSVFGAAHPRTVETRKNYDLMLENMKQKAEAAKRKGRGRTRRGKRQA